MGAEAYRTEQEEKIRILKFLLENYNDGRKKTFFCLVVNLLELEDLREVLRQVRTDEKFQGFSLKEQAAHVTERFQAVADAQGIRLKLRKKK